MQGSRYFGIAEWEGSPLVETCLEAVASEQDSVKEGMEWTTRTKGAFRGRA